MSSRRAVVRAARGAPRRDRPIRLRRLLSAVALAVCVACAALCLVVLAAVVAYIAWNGLPALRLELFTTVPTGDVQAPGGMAHALVGTGILLGMASMVGVPLGVACGVHLAEGTGDRLLRGAVRFACDVLAGVPSIVVGILGYELVVVPIGRYNGIAGAFALAFIMIPIVARATEEMLRLVPDTLREAALALGASRATTLFRVVLPTAFPGVVTGLMLALARVAGETAPLLFTALGSRFLTLDPTQPFPSLTVQIFSWATGPYEAQRQVAWAGMLVLVALVLAVNLLTRGLLARRLAPRGAAQPARATGVAGAVGAAFGVRRAR
jgi:phosphate transport system permease protein